MVIISDEMKYPVDDYPVEFIIELSTILMCILPDAVNTYEEVSGDSVALALVKGNDIRKIVMPEISPVDVKDVVVGTENHSNISCTSDLAFSYEPYPAPCQYLFPETERSLFKMK